MADGFDIDLRELNQLAVALTKTGGQVGRRASVALHKTAFDVEATAKEFAPVDTGALMNSIGTDFYGDGRFESMSAEIGPTVDYGAYVEWGTSTHAPQAFMGPALDRHGWELEAAIADLADVLE